MRLILSVRLFFISALFVFVCTLCAPRGAWALTVDAVRLGAHNNASRMVLDLGGPAEFRVFLLPAPNRMVIDLPPHEWNAGIVPPAPAAGIRRVRHGPTVGGLGRIVIDLARPVTIRSAFMLPRDNKRPNRLVVDFLPSNQQRFNAELPRVFGTLQPAVNTAGKLEGLPTPQEPEPPPAKAKNKLPENEKPLIVIDPGHGGEDPGAIGVNGVKEKNVALAIGRELRRQLLETGRYRVHMTRDRDVFIRLRERVNIARDKGGDLFISIHADSINKAGVRGASIYTLSEQASDEETAKLAARENEADKIAGIDLGVEDEEIASILVDLAMRDTMNQSKFVAIKLSQSFPRQGLVLLERPTRSAGFAVLKAPDIPSVLVETGYMSNAKDANLLNTPAHQRRIANALLGGIDAYFKKVEERRNN